MDARAFREVEHNGTCQNFESKSVGVLTCPYCLFLTALDTSCYHGAHV